MNMHDLKTLVLDWGSLANGAVLLTLSGSILLLCRSVTRARTQLQRELARIFEQLDLLRLDAQRQPAGDMSVATAQPERERELPVLAAVHGTLDATVASSRKSRRGAAAEVGDYYAAAQLAASGTPINEISERCGIVSGEARVLVALQQARARRAGAA
jgi:hypothetical protein